MNLTNVMLFGKAIIGDGGSSDGGRLFLHKRFESAAELKAQPSIPMNAVEGTTSKGFTLYKCFSETPTYAEAEGGLCLYCNDSGATFAGMRFDEVEDMGIAWGIVNSYGQGIFMCISADTAETLGVEAGIYITEECFNGAVKEVFIIGA